MSGTWHRVSKTTPCPICKKPDWCLVARDGSAAVCARMNEGALKRAGEAGWLHRLPNSEHRRDRRRTLRISTINSVAPDFSVLAQTCVSAANPVRLLRLADGLGVSVVSLQRLHVGWDGEAWSFPMQNATCGIIGIRRRFPCGRKLSVKGGHEGLFIPRDLPDSGLLLITEGPTDCAAMLDMNFAVVGRPSCTGGTWQVVPLARGRDVVIVADGDEPGRRGATILASVLTLHCHTVRVIAPPNGIKDARAWKRSGATRENIVAAIDAAPILRLSIQSRQAPGRAKVGV